MRFIEITLLLVIQLIFSIIKNPYKGLPYTLNVCQWLPFIIKYLKKYDDGSNNIYFNKSKSK